MGTITKIRAEIERLEGIDYPCDTFEESIGFYNALDRIKSFLDTLEEETSYDTQKYTPRPSVSIEDVARVQFASHAKVVEKKRKAIFDWEQFKEVAGIFYGFGKKDSSDTLEEPVCEELEEAVGKRLRGVCNLAEETKEDRPLEERLQELKEIREKKELEEAVTNYIAPIENEDGLKVINFSGQDIKDAFIAGAKWQKEQFEKNRLAACDRMTKEDCEREMNFADEIILKEHRQPTFSDAINYGMQLQKKQMMKDAVEVQNVVEEGRYCPEIGPIYLNERAGFVPGDKVKLIIIKDNE